LTVSQTLKVFSFMLHGALPTSPLGYPIKLTIVSCSVAKPL